LPASQIPFWHSLLELPAGAAPDELGFFVGPEGGWSPAELALLSDRAVALSLGPPYPAGRDSGCGRTNGLAGGAPSLVAVCFWGLTCDDGLTGSARTFFMTRNHHH